VEVLRKWVEGKSDIGSSSKGMYTCKNVYILKLYDKQVELFMKEEIKNLRGMENDTYKGE
jgi:hypothetical protein